MGLPMARNLLEAGVRVRAWNRSAERTQSLADNGAEVAEDPREAAEGAEFLITMLSDAAAVLDTAAAALDGAAENVVWIQMSTIGIEGTDRCIELAARHGVTFVDAPVLGTRQPAEEGKLVILASGPERARDRVQPVFEPLSVRTLWLGEAGGGTRCKVVVNNWIVGVVGVLAETISLAEGLGVDPNRFFDAIEGGALDLPYARLKGAMMMDQSFDDASFRLALARKDAELVLAAAEQGGIELSIAEAVAARMQRAEQDGHGDEDMAATYWVSAPSHARAR
jgi:3-hydroxyisobutyrate dehydrogenase